MPRIELEWQVKATAEAVAPLWQELEARARPRFFLSWGWIGPWLKESRADPHLLVGRAGNRVVLLGLLHPGRPPRRMLARPRALMLHHLGDDAEDMITIEYNAFLVDPAWADRAPTAALAFLLSRPAPDGRRYAEVRVRGGDGTLESAVPAGTSSAIRARRPSFRVDLAALRTSGKSFIDNLGSSTRYQLRRSLRLYGAPTLDRAADADTALVYLDGLKELHQRYWQGRGKPGCFATPFFERFHRRVITDNLPLGTVELARITAGDRVIGYLYNFCSNGHVLAYQSGFDYPEDSRLKPGLVSHYLCLSQHLSQGAGLYDFLAGDSRYKANLGEAGPDMVDLVFQGPDWMLATERLALRLRDRVRSPPPARPLPGHDGVGSER
jgi:CelD/BcsL family acetyltransferase involved in cellulose biosynthesis